MRCLVGLCAFIVRFSALAGEPSDRSFDEAYAKATQNLRELKRQNVKLQRVGAEVVARMRYNNWLMERELLRTEKKTRDLEVSNRAMRFDLARIGLLDRETAPLQFGSAVLKAERANPVRALFDANKESDGIDNSLLTLIGASDLKTHNAEKLRPLVERSRPISNPSDSKTDVAINGTYTYQWDLTDRILKARKAN